MSRLIDADKLKVAVYHSFAPYQYEWARTISDISNVIDNQPTAYDVEEVVKELEEEMRLADKEKERCARENPLQFDNAKGYANGIANAIEIVRKGGAK